MPENKNDVLSLDELEKSWTDSATLLKSIIGDENKELQKSEKDEKKKDLSKAKKDDEAEDDEDDMTDGDEEAGESEEDEGESEEEEAAEKKGIKKSLADDMGDDEETVAAMDVEPFLKKFVKSVSRRLDAIKEENANLRADNAKITNVLAKSILALGQQNMNIAATVDAIANTPVGSRSVIRKSMEKYGDKGGDSKASAAMDLIKSMTKDDILEKAVRLSKSGVLTSHDVAKINTRINKEMPLEEAHVIALTSKEGK